MDRTNIITIGTIVLIIVVAGLYAHSRQQAIEETTNSGADNQAATALTAPLEGVYTDLLGNEIDLRAYDGRVRVVNSWASWCPFCVNELPDFAALAREYADENVHVIAINRKETPRLANQYVDSLGDLTGIIFVLDSADHFYSAIGAFTMPETIFYDAAGNVVVHKRGFMTVDEMRIHVDAALAASK